MKTCATCRHHDHTVMTDTLGSGVCKAIRFPEKPGEGRARLSGVGTDHLLITESDFGCTLHQDRPAEPRIPDELWGVFLESSGEPVLNMAGEPVVFTSLSSAAGYSRLLSAHPTRIK